MQPFTRGLLCGAALSHLFWFLITALVYWRHL